MIADRTDPARRMPRGAAMVLVLVALGLAAAMAAAMLGSNAIRAQCAENAADATIAHYLAESGTNVAMYYLQYPDRYTGPKPNGYYPGQDSVPLGKTAAGTVQTRVSYDAATKTYTVNATAELPRRSHTYSRDLQASLLVLEPSETQLDTPTDALVVDADVPINNNTIIDGSVKSLGSVTVSGGRVSGDVASDVVTISGTGAVDGTIKTLAEGLLDSDPAATNVDAGAIRAGLTALTPQIGQVKDLRSYSTRDDAGVPIHSNATRLLLNSQDNVTLGSTLANPAGVYWHEGDLTISGNCTIDGTLIIRGGEVRLAPGARLTVRPASGFPAIVSEQAIRLGEGSTISADGLVHAASIATSAPLVNGTVAVNGALVLCDKVQPLPASTDFVGTIAVRYDAAKAQASGFGVVRPPAFSRGVRVLAWSE